MAKVQPLQINAIRLARAHLALAGIYAVFIMMSDAWNLVARSTTSQRWLMFGLLLIVTGLVWFLSRGESNSPTYYRALICALILTDLALATFAIYSERGMSSRGVALYAIPIASSAALLSRSAIFGTAALSVATYVMAATRYFYVYFNEGYKVELYSTLIFYSLGFFVLASILWVAVSTPSNRK